MLKKISFALMLMVAGAGFASAQRTITIEGKINFPDTRNNANMDIVRSAGFDRVTHVSVPANADGTYRMTFRVEEPGQYTLMCQGGHERVNFWAEDEDLVINFRGMDTARVRMIGPTYVHIKGGPNNDLMNRLNWESFRNYWDAAEMSRVPGGIEEVRNNGDLGQTLSSANYSAMGRFYFERLNHIARYYADANSAVVLLGQLRDNEMRADLLARLEARDPNYGPLVNYKREVAEREEHARRLAQGNPAPAFSYETPDGTQKLGPSDFKGKILVIDFWASWCSPCIAEIPHLKEAYAAYKDKGVEILAVSLDRDDAAWRRSMANENMPWPQVKAPDAGREVMELYQFSGIPHIVVIDRNGNIVGKNYRGKALMDKLEELTSERREAPRSIRAIGM
ncbi:MAG: AhpC/TSA family protein [Rikenellaceae bacterium]|nr:AhpC/TSA family protein [Rikenellaceae bacterium]MCL2691893.1 AhpC/TSA family protein [Rikenellaceae bacterium]